MSDVLLRAFVYGCVTVLTVWALVVVGFMGRGLMMAIASRRGKRAE